MPCSRRPPPAAHDTAPRGHRGDGLPVSGVRSGRVLIALVAQTPPGPDRARLYLADRVERLRVTAVLVCGDELSVGFAADFPTELAARAWRVVADDSARTRPERWLEDATARQAYRSVTAPS